MKIELTHGKEIIEKGETQKKSDKLLEKREEALLGGGSEAIKKQLEKGKLTARQRLELLLDPGTFVETNMFVRHNCNNFGLDKNKTFTDGVVTGFGQVNGRLVYVYSQDFTILGGSLGEAHAKKISQVMDQALQNGAPLIGFNDSGGARIQEGANSLAGYGDIFLRNVRASGVIPQISCIVGPSAGGAVYSPALTDFIIMTEDTSYMFVTGPTVVKTVTGEEASFEDLGGASVHSSNSGIAHLAGADEIESIELIKLLLSYIPSNNLEDPPLKEITAANNINLEELNDIIPDDPQVPYDMREIILRVVDKGNFLEIQKKWAQNIIIGFGRLNGYPVGIVANQPSILAGALDITASTKAARFIRFCDAFNIPIISFVDVPGFLPGLDQEHNGIIKHGAKLIFAYAEATVPKITVITRKAYGGAYIVMGSKHLATDINFAWPSAEIAVMGAEGAVQILYRRELAKAEDSKHMLETLKNEYIEEFNNPYLAAEKGYIDDVILPGETRRKLIAALWPLLRKRDRLPNKKHGNIPL
ncbi:MAG TPA: acyl-CoA carboxylase subunit beta [candidate division Zixibacteria bacterium]|nr:acyl-CoA carboxylase subunit beta [candidate division Zixibacteria bacterium]